MEQTGEQSSSRSDRQEHVPAAKERLSRANQRERPAITVDVVIMSLRQRDLQVLLVKRRSWPYEGMWAIPGGFVGRDESLEETARRELRQKTGAQDVFLEQLYTFGDPGRDPRARVITVVYFALLDAERLPMCAADTVEHVDWFSLYQLPPLAFDHAEILQFTLGRLRSKLDYTTIAFRLLPRQFTLRELQQVYEIILHRQVDKRNFRKKILSTGILEETGTRRMGENHRPARQYQFRSLEGGR